MKMDSRLTYEQALDEIEKISKLLDEGNISLEDAVEKYKQGILLASFCTDKLRQAEEMVMLLVQKDNQLNEILFDEGAL